MTLPSLFARGASVAPDRPFIIDGADRWSHAEANAVVGRLARHLRSTGISRGTPVAVLSPNSGRGFLTILAILRAGAVWVPLNVRNQATSSAAYLDRTGTTRCIVHDDLTDLGEGIREVVDDLEITSLSKLEADAAHTKMDIELPGVFPGDLAVLMPTGGTTGEPKAARLTHRVFDVFAANFLSSMPVADGSATHLMAAPMTHAAGFMAFALMSKGTTNILQPKADPVEILATIERESVTHLFLPPTVIYMLLAAPTLRRHDYSSMTNFVYAAAPMSVAKLRQAIEVFGPVMTQTYGQAEAPMTVTYLSPEDHVAAVQGETKVLASCGRPTPFVDLAILDPEGRPVPAGEPGEICVRGDLVMDGYHGDGSLPRDAWHRTGDVGKVDEEGFVYITDRIRDMIISGGFNIYPGEIEQVLWSHSAVQDCAVVGVPDEKWGEAVTAIVQLRDGHSVDEAELQELVRSTLGGMKTPKSVYFWRELPRSAVGKVLRRNVRDSFWQGRGRAV